MQNARAELETARSNSGQAKIQARKDEKALNDKIRSIARVREEAELDERTRYAKETGKDPQTGKPSVKGGNPPPAAMRHIEKDLRSTGGLMSSRRKPIAIRGKKKVPGDKPKVKMEPTPVDKIRGKLARKRAPKPDIGSRFD